METANQVFKTIDELRAGAVDLFYSRKTISEQPNQSHAAWHLHEVNQLEECQVTQITRLYLQDCKRLTSLSWLEKFPELETLWIYGSDNLSDISGLRSAKVLKRLIIWPSFSASITLDNLAPISVLNELEHLAFSGKTRDGSLAYLDQLQSLKTAFYSNSYSWQEIASFEASHPEVDFPWKGGVVYNANSSVLKCKKCETPQAMLTGKGLKLSCPQCDTSYLKKHIERYSKISTA